MEQYSLTFAKNKADERETIRFEATSLEAALRVAKSSTQGNWADLSQDGKPLCRIHLVSETGVWRISRHSDRETL